MQEMTKTALSKVCDDLVQVAMMVREDEAKVLQSDYISVIKHYNSLRIAAKQIKEAREALADMEERLSREIVPDFVRRAKEELGVKTPIHLEGIGRVSISHRFSCTMLDRERGIIWLDDHGYGDLAQRTVNSNTLAAFARDMLENKGKELPTNLFKTGTSPYTSITKA